MGHALRGGAAAALRGAEGGAAAAAPAAPVALAALAAGGPAARAAAAGPPAAGPGARCELLVAWSLPGLVGAGFGWTFSSLQHLRAYAQPGGRHLLVRCPSEEWLGYGLAPFWTEALPEAEWARRWGPQGPGGHGECPKGVHGLYREFYRCHPPGLFEQQRIAQFWKAETSHGDLTMGDLFLQSLWPLLASRTPPFGGEPYAAVHVRHGDKALDHTPLLSLGALMAALRGNWPDIRNVFISQTPST
ncbi:unnamed protein product [Prorocentrum cordatum]|uniref:Peptide-O-fucosyltransferase 1 n=1 Tax=Prorocentrum cordatum TaxID=2364126 RepID=A0ABN9T225_9DINO|nr:unnamed protein product [Polarella glacialis]